MFSCINLLSGCKEPRLMQYEKSTDKIEFPISKEKPCQVFFSSFFSFMLNSYQIHFIRSKQNSNNIPKNIIPH